MPQLIINSQNIEVNPWIWGFLEKQRKTGQNFWKQGTQFKYDGQTFKLEQSIFARQRKDPIRGYAYEMISKKYLGSGAYGSVSRISCTISLGKNGVFQAKDKHRVVKKQSIYDADNEYFAARYAIHLHVKMPTNGMMVMREMHGQTLERLLQSNDLSREDKLELGKALLNALKEQLVDKKLCHSDLHGGNILVQIHHESGKKSFEVNIIDYGLASYLPDDNFEQGNWDLWTLSKLINRMWYYEENKPEIINQLNWTLSVSNYIQKFNEIVLAPMDTAQKPLDLMFAYLNQQNKVENNLAEELKNNLVQAVKESKSNNIDPIKQAVMACKRRLEETNSDLLCFPYPLFDNNRTRQKLINNISSYLEVIENKGKTLMDSSQQEEGQQLIAMVNNLRKQTFDAVYKPVDEQINALKECGNQCKQQIQQHKKLLDIHRNSDYIWAEIGVILASLIILYPLVAGIHCLATGRFTFFSQTNSARVAEALEQDFTSLLNA